MGIGGNKKYLTCAILLSLTGGLSAYAGSAICASSFGAVPDDGRDDSAALRAAAAFCREHRGTTLTIEPGVYNLADTAAVRLERDVLAGLHGWDPEKSIFTPYYPYSRGLDFSGSRNVTVIASGVTLMCDGWMEPVSIADCRNFTLVGLTVDYVRKPFSQGRIVQMGEGFIDVRYPSDQMVSEISPQPRLELVDPLTGGIFHEPFYFPVFRKISEDTFRYEIQYPLPERLNGTAVAALHSFHSRPAILILNSRNTVLKDVTIHSQPGMGIVGFDSTDILIDGLRVTPSEGYCFSTNTDATHFACCRGKLAIRNSLFVRQGDDATNVHGYYHNLERLEDGWYLQRLEAPTYTHAQLADVPRVGDKVEICDASNLAVLMTVRVSAVSHEGTERDVRVCYDRALPDDVSGLYAFNISKLPSLEFTGNAVIGNLARGVLVKTRNVLIQGNVFKGCTGTAVHVGAESGWREGSHSRNVTVSKNVMVDCGYGTGCQGGASGVAVLLDAPDPGNVVLHDGICITENLIYGGSNGLRPCGICVHHASNVRVEGNVVTDCSVDAIVE